MTRSTRLCTTLTHHYQRLKLWEANRKNMYLLVNVIGWNNNMSNGKAERCVKLTRRQRTVKEDVYEYLWSMIDHCTRSRNLRKKKILTEMWQHASNVRERERERVCDFSFVSFFPLSDSTTIICLKPNGIVSLSVAAAVAILALTAVEIPEDITRKRSFSFLSLSLSLLYC